MEHLVQAGEAARRDADDQHLDADAAEREPGQAPAQVGEPRQAAARERHRQQAQPDDDEHQHRAEGIGTNGHVRARTPVHSLKFRTKGADAGRVPYPPGKEVQVKGQLYRVAFTASLLVILVEGLGAGSKWG